MDKQAGNDPYAMRDPRTQYPQPDFAKQPQPAPGLAKDMVPRPDHGETSYRGNGRLHGRKALEDADEVIALLTGEGHTVLGLPGDLKDEAFCKELVAKTVKELGGLDIRSAEASRAARGMRAGVCVAGEPGS